MVIKVRVKLKGSKKLKIAVVSIFKNESMGIREWLTHYKDEGFDKAILLDNGSTDDYRDAIKGLESFVAVLDAAERHSQVAHYNNLALPQLMKEEIDVVAILDMDEYMFSLDGRTLRCRLENFFGENDNDRVPSGFLCRWTMFGSSGHVNQPSSIRKFFTKRKKEQDIHTKGVYWAGALVSGGIGIHYSQVTHPTDPCPEGIQLNHYPIQSKEFFSKVKMTRGDVHSPGFDNFRDWKYFDSYDFDEMEDVSLSERVSS